MRLIASFVAACLVLITQPAAADPTPTPRTVETNEQSHLSAARETLHSMFIDFGMLSAISDEAFLRVPPVMRAQVAAWPFYDRLSPEKRSAIASYIDNFPAIGSEEATLGAPEVIETFVPRFAALFSEAELRDLNVYVRLPEAQSYMRRAAIDGVRNGPSATTEPTEAEFAAFDRFSRTPGGAAFNAHASEFGAIMRDVGYAAGSNPRVTRRMQRDLCAILADQCPAEWRSI